MADPKKAESEKKNSAEKSGGSPLVGLLSLVNLGVTLGILSFLVIAFQKEKKKESLQDISLEEPEGEGGAKEASHGETGEKASAKKEGGGHKKEGGEHGGGASEASEEGGTSSSRMIDLNPLTINLATVSGVAPKFVRVSLSIEPHNAEVSEEIQKRLPQVQNIVIDIFNSKKATDLSTVDGRDFIKEEIKNSINNFLIKGKIQGIYFTNFSISG